MQTDNTNQNKIENPLIAKNKSRIPGIVYRLPSLGKFYENTNILSDEVENGEVTVYPMRLRDELRMKAVDSIFQGTSVTETLSYCVPQVNEPKKLISEDVDYLLTVIKKITHGATISYKDVCFKKSEDSEDKVSKIAEDLAKKELDDSVREESYRVNDTLKESLESGEAFNMEEDEITYTEDGQEVVKKEITSDLCEFFIPLDYFIQNCKPLNPDTIQNKLTFMFKDFEVESRPLTFEQFKELSIMRLKDETKMNNDEFVDHITNFSNSNIAFRIKRVDEITDPEMIAEWVESLSLEERKEMFKKLEEGLDWGMNFEYEIECPKCGLKRKTDQSYLNPLYFFLT